MSTRGRGAKGGDIPKFPRLSQSLGPMSIFVTHGGNGDKQAVEKQQGPKSIQKRIRKRIRKKTPLKTL